MNDDEAFLQAIATTPDDDSPRLIYADWLDERGDQRARYLRILLLATDRIRNGSTWEDLKPTFQSACDDVNAEWHDRVGPWFKVMLDSVEPERLIDTVLAIRSGTRLGLTEIKGILDEAKLYGTAAVSKHLTLDAAERLRETMEAVPWQSSLGPPCRASLQVCLRN
jgi:uncharacterized protein (TIGR02996 family)